MRKAWVLPAVSVVGGILGLLVRHFYLARAFEPGTGLPLSGQPVTYALWAVAILTAVALGVLSRGRHRTFEKSYTSAFGRGNMIQTSCNLAAAVMFLAAGFFNIEAYVSAPIYFLTGRKAISVIRPILGLLCLATAAGLWFVMQGLTRKGELRSAWVTLPGFTSCIWLMAGYQTWSQDPVLSRYLFCLLAVLLAVVACYCLPGFAFGKGQVVVTLMACLLGAAFCIMVLGDGLPMYDLALYLGMAFYLLSMASLLLANDARPEPPVIPTCGGSCQGCTGCGPVPPAEEA